MMQEPDNSFVAVKEHAGQPSLKDIERLAAELQRFSGVQGLDLTGGAPEQLIGDVEQIALELDTLRMGDPPTDINEGIRQVWLAMKIDWACQTTFSQFQDSLRRLLEPLQKSITETKQFEDEVGLRRERLETLRLLVDLLDELICIEQRNAAGTEPIHQIIPNN